MDDEKCPTCSREFKDIKDFPMVYVAEVSVIKPEEIPEAIPGWHKEHLLEKKVKGWNRKLVPKDVLAYFKEHPEEEELVHSDNFIYKIPYEDSKGYQGVKLSESYRPKLWRRHYNYTSEVRKLIEENQALKEYFKDLEEMALQEVATTVIIPNWEQGSQFKLYCIPDSILRLGLNESEKRINGYRVSEISLFGEGPNLGSAGGPTMSQLIKIGHIEYEGRLRL